MYTCLGGITCRAHMVFVTGNLQLRTTTVLLDTNGFCFANNGQNGFTRTRWGVRFLSRLKHPKLSIC